MDIRDKSIYLILHLIKAITDLDTVNIQPPNADNEVKNNNTKDQADVVDTSQQQENVLPDVLSVVNRLITNQNTEIDSTSTLTSTPDKNNILPGVLSIISELINKKPEPVLVPELKSKPETEPESISTPDNNNILPNVLSIISELINKNKKPEPVSEEKPEEESVPAPESISTPNNNNILPGGPPLGGPPLGNPTPEGPPPPKGTEQRTSQPIEISQENEYEDHPVAMTFDVENKPIVVSLTKGNEVVFSNAIK
jgi:hypothetical protein